MGASAGMIEGVYGELRRIAGRHLRRLPSATLQPTVLLHEAYLRLDRSHPGIWQSKTHFVATASITMRRVLVDYVRERTAHKRAGHCERVSLESSLLLQESSLSPMDLLALDEALIGLAAIDARKARVTELRFFGGLEFEEIAALLEVSVPTVKRDWRFARAWLFENLRSRS
jgi:RNA polymerase sigma factor (TIGR02999 family)